MGKHFCFVNQRLVLFSLGKLENPILIFEKVKKLASITPTNFPHFSNFFQEEQNRGKPNWEHLNDELHVLITVEDTENRAQAKLARAVEEVQKLLTVVSKRCSL